MSVPDDPAELAAKKLDQLGCIAAGKRVDAVETIIRHFCAQQAADLARAVELLRTGPKAHRKVCVKPAVFRYDDPDEDFGEMVEEAVMGCETSCAACEWQRQRDELLKDHA